MSGWGLLAGAWSVLVVTTFAAFLLLQARRRASPDALGAADISSETFSPRMAVMDFIARAQKAGWDVTGRNLQIMDLLHGLREACLQGRIRMWGRPQQKIEAAAMTELHRPVPIPHWRDYQLDVGTIVGRSDNFETKTCNLAQDDPHEGGFVDLYLDRQASLDWLESSAERYKGAYLNRRGV